VGRGVAGRDGAVEVFRTPSATLDATGGRVRAGSAVLDVIIDVVLKAM
jgi:hypothetical protein